MFYSIKFALWAILERSGTSTNSARRTNSVDAHALASILREYSLSIVQNHIKWRRKGVVMSNFLQSLTYNTPKQPPLALKSYCFDLRCPFALFCTFLRPKWPWSLTMYCSAVRSNLKSNDTSATSSVKQCGKSDTSPTALTGWTIDRWIHCATVRVWKRYRIYSSNNARLLCNRSINLTRALGPGPRSFSWTNYFDFDRFFLKADVESVQKYFSCNFMKYYDNFGQSESPTILDREREVNTEVGTKYWMAHII